MTDFVLKRPGGPLGSARKVLAVSLTVAASRLSYVSEVLVRMMFLSVFLFTIANLWSTVERYQDIEAATGFDLVQLIWYLAFAQAVLSSAPSLPNEALEVDREVRSGDIAYRLVRPLPYVLYHLGSYLGLRVANLLVLVLPLFAMAWLLVGSPQLTASAVGAAALAGLLALVVDGVWSFSLSMAAFWVEDTYGLHLLYRRCVMLLGGLLVPLEAYPEWLRRIALALPFRLIIHGPARLFIQPDASGFGALLASQLAFAAVGVVPLLLLYRAGMRRVAANGG